MASVPEEPMEEATASSDDLKRTLTADLLRTKIEHESLEFAFLKPICAQVLQNPTSENLKMFESALNEVGTVPVHLSEFVSFPFAIHLKVIRTYKEPQRIEIFRTLAKLLDKAALSRSKEIFINIFEKLHISLTTPTNITTVNGQLSEEETEWIVTCIKNVTFVSLEFHMDTLCEPGNVKIIGHAVFLLLQLVGPNFSKATRLKSLQVLEKIASLCEGQEKRCSVLYNFLPGIVSSLRKISLPSAGNSVKAVIIKALAVMSTTIKATVEFQPIEKLAQADAMLSQIVQLLSKEFILNSDVDYRKSFLNCCCDIATRKSQLPNCGISIASILRRMTQDSETSISDDVTDVIQTTPLPALTFDDFTNLLASASSSLSAGNEVACILSLREISSGFTTSTLSFIEFQAFLPLLFRFMNDMIWRLRRMASHSKQKTDPVYMAASRVCENLAHASDLDQVVFELVSTVSDLQSSSHSIEHPTGVLVVFNLILPKIHSLSPEKISDFEAANLAEVYLSVGEALGSQIAKERLDNEIPAVQTAADLRKCIILEGIGILGQLYPATVAPLVLYPLLEHAGTNSEAEQVNEIAEEAIKRLAGETELNLYLKQNLDLILNEISLRMLNLLLYPNCPQALCFLSDYFDFSDDKFSIVIEQVFTRCSDELGGCDQQHIYVKVFYALIKSISNFFPSFPGVEINPELKKASLLEKMLAYQKAVGLGPPETEDVQEEEAMETEEAPVSPVIHLTDRICHRLVNFLPNEDRDVRLAAMDSLILGVKMLSTQENLVLPLSHTIWQNLLPRIDERDYVVVRKSFDLLKTMCVSSGGFLRKRTIEEAFPKLSNFILTLAKEGEQVKHKNRQYYTCTQAYKLQLTILQGLNELIQAIDVQEIELDRIVSGCVLYLNPNQNKNLRNAAKTLLENISKGKYCRTVWMKLIKHGIVKKPESIPDESFVRIPEF